MRNQHIISPFDGVIASVTQTGMSITSSNPFLFAVFNFGYTPVRMLAIVGEEVRAGQVVAVIPAPVVAMEDGSGKQPDDGVGKQKELV